MRVEVTEVTPDMAIKLMGDNANNRLLSRTRVTKLVTEIRSGNWQLNGETVIVSKSGKLLDGQHRLAAVALAGKTVPMVIAFDAPEDAVATIDTGRSRSTSDILSMNGIEGGHTIAASAGLFWRMMTAAVPVAILPASYAITILERYPSFGYWGKRISKTKGLTAIIPPAALIPALVYLTSVANREDLANRLFDGLATGAGLRDGDPVLALRNRLLNRRVGVLRRSSANVWPAMVRVVSALEAGNDIQRVHMSSDTATTSRPERLNAHMSRMSSNQRLVDLVSVSDVGNFGVIPGYTKQRDKHRKQAEA